MISFNLSRYLHYNRYDNQLLAYSVVLVVYSFLQLYTIKQPLSISKRRVMVIHPLLHQDLAGQMFLTEQIIT